MMDAHTFTEDQLNQYRPRHMQKLKNKASTMARRIVGTALKHTLSPHLMTESDREFHTRAMSHEPRHDRKFATFAEWREQQTGAVING